MEGLGQRTRVSDFMLFAFFFFFCFNIEEGYTFPGGSDGKESACNAGDPGLFPGSERSSGEGDVYSLQYSCVKNFMARGAWGL